MERRPEIMQSAGRMSVAPSTDVMLLLLSAIVHAMHWCATDGCESDDDDEPAGMYS